MSKSTGRSAPGGLSSFPLTHNTGNTKRPNANDEPREMVSLREPAAPRAADEHPKHQVLNSRGEHIGTIYNDSLPTAARIAGHTHLTRQRDGSWKAHAPTRTARASSMPLAKSLKTAKGSVEKTLAQVSAQGATTAQVKTPGA